jgi:hypothetical protein
MQTLTQDKYSLPLISTGLTKSQIKEMAETAIQSVLERGNVTQVAEALSAMDEFKDLVRKDDRFIDAVVEEVGKNGGKASTPSGARIEVCETGVRYDYSANPGWVELELQLKAIEKKKKELEDKIKKIPAGKILVDEETGESLCGAPKSSKTNYKLTLQK